jgi:hypothetical protein
MSLRRRTLTTTTVAAVSAAMALGASTLAPASAKSAPNDARKLDSNVIMPFQVAVRGGTTWTSDGFDGTITRRTANGHKQVIASVNGEIAGVAVKGRQLAFTESPNNGFTRLVVRRPGRGAMVVNLRRYERLRNPDANKTYGIISGGNACARDFFRNATGAPARYKGIVDSHPYQVEALPGGWAVAEAAGNAILRVNNRGQISTIAVLPRQSVLFTQQKADAIGAPDCVVGVRYGFEPVPTDVERDGHGNLWVSLLPGGPEDPSLGARGAVYKITKSGAVIRVARGFLGATNLAVRGGKVYVAELFKNRISTVRNGHIVTVRSIARPVSVEVTKHNLFIGQLARFGQQGPVPGTSGVFRFPR